MSNGDPRYASRKWILTKWSMGLYTIVHLLNAGMVLKAAHMKLLPPAAIEPLWAGSLTVWSMGLAGIIGLYMTGNVAASMVAKRKGGPNE